MKPIIYAHINIFHNNGYWFKIWMEFLRPLLLKIELICQQLAMPQLSGVERVSSQPRGAVYDGWGSRGGLAMIQGCFFWCGVRSGH